MNASIFNKRIGERIRILRIEKDWTIASLELKADISKGYLTKVENGHGGLGVYKLYTLAVALGVSLDYIVKGK